MTDITFAPSVATYTDGEADAIVRSLPTRRVMVRLRPLEWIAEAEARRLLTIARSEGKPAPMAFAAMRPWPRLRLLLSYVTEVNTVALPGRGRSPRPRNP